MDCRHLLLTGSLVIEPICRDAGFSFIKRILQNILAEFLHFGKKIFRHFSKKVVKDDLLDCSYAMSNRSLHYGESVKKE